METKCDVPIGTLAGSLKYREDVQEFLTNVSQTVTREVKLYRDKIGEQTQALLAEGQHQIRAWVDDRLLTDSGLASCRIYLSHIRDRLNTYCETLKDKEIGAESNIDKKSEAIEEKETEYGNVWKAGAIKRMRLWFGSNKRNKEMGKELKESVKSRIAEERQHVLYREVRTVYGRLAAWIEEEETRLAVIDGDAKEAKKRLRRAIKNIHKTSEGPFSREISSVEEGDKPRKFELQELVEFRRWMDDKAIGVDDVVKGLKSKLLSYTNTGLSANQQSAEQALMKLEPTPTKAREAVRVLREMAKPMWSYNESRVSGQLTTELICLVATAGKLDGKSKSILDEPAISSILDTTQYPAQHLRTADRKRIVCVMVEAAVAAFVIDGVEAWRDKFLQKGNAYYHTSDVYERCESLLPNRDDRNREADVAMSNGL